MREKNEHNRQPSIQIRQTDGYYGYVKLTEIAKIERCRSGIIYPEGSVYIQVSACAKNSAEKWRVLQTAGELEGKYAVVIPTVSVLPLYLKEALEYTADEFFCRYIGGSINISMELFKFYTLPFHSRIEEQKRVLELLNPVQLEIEAVEAGITATEKLKEWFLQNLLV